MAFFRLERAPILEPDRVRTIQRRQRQKRIEDNSRRGKKDEERDEND